MTKEELEKEVEEYLENKRCKIVCSCEEVRECKEGIRVRCMYFNYEKGMIVNFVEPREKHIIEKLKAQIEKMKQCGNCGNRTIGNCEYCKRKPNQIFADNITSDY